jgi:hypothetical protein
MLVIEAIVFVLASLLTLVLGICASLKPTGVKSFSDAAL